MIAIETSNVIQILSSTPDVIRGLVKNLDDKWLHANEGEETWTPHEVVAHLIYGEQTDWIARMRIILSDMEDKKFTPFDRKAHLAIASGRSIESLLDQFDQLRKENINILSSENITEDDLNKTGIHPAFGQVTLSQLLSSWVVHDMTHIYQISRIIAKQYDVEVGPWKEYMGILNR